MRTAATAAAGGGAVACETMAGDDDPRRLSFEPIDVRFGVFELDTTRPEMPSRMGFTTVSSSSTSIATSTDDGSDRLSLLSRSATQQPFDQDSWVAAYEQNQTTATTPNTAGAASSLLSTSAPSPTKHVFNLTSLPQLSNLSLVLDWEDDDYGDNDHEENVMQNKATLHESSPFQRETSPMSTSFFDDTNTHSQTLTPVIPSSSTFSPTFSSPRNMSYVIPGSSYSQASPLPLRFKPTRRYSYIPSQDLDHDDRFIENVKARLKESEELEFQKIKQQQEFLDAAAAATQKPASKRFSNILPSFLGLSSPPATPTLDQSQSIQSSPDAQSVAENRSLSQSNRNQNGWGEDLPPPVAESEQSPKKPSQLVSFINRAFGPRRNLQAQQQQRRSTIQGTSSTFPRRNHDPHTLDGDSTNNTNNNQKAINRASMPHVAWSSWSSNTVMTPSGSTSSKRISRASSTTSSAAELVRGGSGNSSARETRELIAQGLKLFEVGATETAFATFQRAAASAAPSDTFARFCVAVCIVHGYGCTEDNGGVQMLKELKGMGEVLADEELEILGIE
ncbi:hypothetical protein HK100_001888 [Physocladia obscura]|uniref:Uncharacterized protein n=1 Tax=Physocladia obscura TaxID=109957 RepID=A0AAD5SXB9_9FUNG|nr:hypothetical protein HK100_001888 [Physocladia obscura]